MEKDNQLKIDDLSVYKSALVLRAMNNKMCQQILKLLHKEKRVLVTDLYNTLPIKQSVTFRHLAILKNAGLVQTEREGNKIFYSLNYARLEEVQTSINNLLGSSS